MVGENIDAFRIYRIVSFGKNNYNNLNENIDNLDLVPNSSRKIAMYTYEKDSVLVVHPNPRVGFSGHISKAIILSNNPEEVNGLVKKLKSNKIRLKQI